MAGGVGAGEAAAPAGARPGQLVQVEPLVVGKVAAVLVPTDLGGGKSALSLKRWDLADCSGLLLPAERLIVLNAAERASANNDPPLRRSRFTLAHELGHWICHAHERPESQPVYCRQVHLADPSDRSLEREANVFAAELLMPESAVRQAWAETREVDACATRLNVSRTATHWRLYSFDLVEDAPRREHPGAIED